jgi:hypothetical protein
VPAREHIRRACGTLDADAERGEGERPEEDSWACSPQRRNRSRPGEGHADGIANGTARTGARRARHGDGMALCPVSPYISLFLLFLLLLLLVSFFLFIARIGPAAKVGLAAAARHCEAEGRQFGWREGKGDDGRCGSMYGSVVLVSRSDRSRSWSESCLSS